MCLAIPGKIIAIFEGEAALPEAEVSFDGLIKRICLACTPEAAPGDYVLVHAGLAIARIDTREAERTLTEITRYEVRKRIS